MVVKVTLTTANAKCIAYCPTGVALRRGPMVGDAAEFVDIVCFALLETTRTSTLCFSIA